MKSIHTSKKEGLNFRFQWIDWVLLILLTGAVCLGGLYVWNRRQAAIPITEIEYTLCISRVSNRFLGADGWGERFPIGATVTTANGTATLGKVLAVEARPTLVESISKGKITWIESESSDDLFLTVAAKAKIKDGDGIRVSDIRIAAGEKGSFRIGKFYVGDASVISVVRKEQNETKES